VRRGLRLGEPRADALHGLRPARSRDEERAGSDGARRVPPGTRLPEWRPAARRIDARRGLRADRLPRTTLAAAPVVSCAFDVEDGAQEWIVIRDGVHHGHRYRAGRRLWDPRDDVQLRRLFPDLP